MALQEVLTRFGFSFDGNKLSMIERGVKRSISNLDTMAKNATAFNQRMSGVFTRAKQLIGVYLGQRLVRTFTSDYAQGADAIAKFSNGLGINAQQYQRLTHAAQLNGITIAELNVALPNLAKRAGDAADGSKEAAVAFRRAGVEIREGGKLKDPIRLLTELADGMKIMKDEGRRTQVLMNLFGRAGKKMGVLLSQGSEGIKKAMAEADKLGIVLSQKALKDAENFNDEMLRVKSIAIGIRNSIASRLLPTINKAMRAFQLWWREGRNAERAMRALKLVAIFAGLVIARMISAAVIRNVALFVKGIWASVQALRAMNTAAAAAHLKITAIFLAFALIALIIEDLVGFAQGKDSVIGRLLGDTKLADDLRKSLIDIGKEAVKAWEELKPALSDAWREAKPAIEEIWEAIRPLIGPAFRAGIQGLILSFKGAASALRRIALGIKIIKALIGGMITVAKHVKGAWDIATAGIRQTLSTIISGARTALGVLGLITGKGKVITAVEAGMKVVTEGMPPSLPMAPAPAGGTMTSATANVAPGAVQITVNAQGDPREIAQQVSIMADRKVRSIFTNASRDLVKAPRGQS